MTRSWMYVSLIVSEAAILLAGRALIDTLTVQGGPAQWFGHQLLIGIRFGVGFQVPFTAVQVVLGADDIPTGKALTMFPRLVAVRLLFVSCRRDLAALRCPRRTVVCVPYKCIHLLCNCQSVGTTDNTC